MWTEPKPTIAPAIMHDNFGRGFVKKGARTPPVPSSAPFSVSGSLFDRGLMLAGRAPSEVRKEIERDGWKRDTRLTKAFAVGLPWRQRRRGKKKKNSEEEGRMRIDGGKAGGPVAAYQGEAGERTEYTCPSEIKHTHTALALSIYFIYAAGRKPSVCSHG